MGVGQVGSDGVRCGDGHREPVGVPECCRADAPEESEGVRMERCVCLRRYVGGTVQDVSRKYGRVQVVEVIRRELSRRAPTMREASAR